MDKIRRFLDKLLYGLAGVSFVAMVILTCWQVFTRYLLKNPSPWSEELVSYLFGWMALIGASIVTGERGHMNIPVLIERQRPVVKKGFLLFSEAVAFAFSAVIFVYGGVKITSLAMGQLTSSLGVAVGVFYIIMPVCGVLNMGYVLLNMADICRKEAA
ncbi:MAG: TRAP transporter small permease [Lachnospiraceae bacterium]|nr:TRAP transporter small permease [Lachnospiraceae bacterium]NBJ80986.1 TRAP transporter small permease [bacterium 1XD42-76]NBK04195.1 TRAP transporter small permease [bacterium 1XD42-94]